MFRKVLIANRGEIAVRIAATCQAMGIAVVAVYSEADAGAMHVRAADEAYAIGAAPAAASYLNVEAIIEAALQAGADALHPGYGFLSENPALAEACREAGITFIGPSPEAMRLLASKVAAKRLAVQAGVPVAPGYDGEAQDDQTMLAHAREIGPPLLIKAAAGGGGRGMREVHSLDAFLDALAAARREARGAFGDDTVLLERLIDEPRHIEIQVLGDLHGGMIHLGERECSIQRRHQKIVEEAPSSAVTAELRAEMGAAAVRVARAAGYTNAGTAEFMLAADGSYYFLEMNARLQVEHPVTEVVTGLDLVELQLRLAAGEPLSLQQDEISPRGHAIECRIYAEDASAGFLPSTGSVRVFSMPQGPGIRLDAGVEAHDSVSVYYDSMLAKLIAWGETRESARRRARWALQRGAVLGVTTNIAYLDAIMGHPRFAAGDLSTAFVTRYQGSLAATMAVPPHDVLLLAAATVFAHAHRNTAMANDPWRSDSAWTSSSHRTVTLQAADATYAIAVLRRDARAWSAKILDDLYEIIDVRRETGDRLTLHLLDRLIHGHATRDRGRIEIAYRGHAWAFTMQGPAEIDSSARHHGPVSGDRTLHAPMPGTIIKVYVQAGERVEARQRLIVLEAMKMEHVVEAPYSGTVRALPHAVGDLVAAGESLVELEEG